MPFNGDLTEWGACRDCTTAGIAFGLSASLYGVYPVGYKLPGFFSLIPGILQRKFRVVPDAVGLTFASNGIL